MKRELRLVRIDSDYCNYLRTFDSKVPYNYNEKELRPFVGVLFQVNEIKYFAPLSSPRPKHKMLKDKIDFMKLDGGKLGAINFNNMVPVMDCNVQEINLYQKGKTKQEIQYQNLLKEQLRWLNRHKSQIYGKGSRLYKAYQSKQLEKNIKARCCCFPLLEKKCLAYNKIEEMV